MMSTLQMTDEQTRALELFKAGGDVVVEAGAGTGKTATLVGLAFEEPNKRGQYVAFNKAITVEAASKLPRTCASNTAHSLAYRSYGSEFAHRLRGGGRMPSGALGKAIGAKGLAFNDLGRYLGPGLIASIAARTVVRFCQTADLEIMLEHVPFQEGLAETSDEVDWGNQKILREHVVPLAKKIWLDALRVDGQLPYKHDYYLKGWELSGPVMPVDYIMFDEAQDASPVLKSIVEQQTHAQKIWVGDSCQPPGTMVKVVREKSTGRWGPEIDDVPIELIREGDRVVTFDNARFFRDGRVVTGISSRQFVGELVVAKVGEAETRYTPDHRCVVRLGDAYDGKHLVYLMKRGNQYRVGRTRGAYKGGGFGLAHRTIVEGADAAWVLSVHETIEEASLAEYVTAWQHNLPTLRFCAARTNILTQEGLDKFWCAVGDNSWAATTALSAAGRELAFPLLTRDKMLTKRRSTIMRACNIDAGMRMVKLPESGNVTRESWDTIEVTRARYTGPVWSMDVDDHHTYVADGVATHNCQQLYAFTGAVNALADVPGDRTWLTNSFRFGPAVADVANGVLDQIGSELRIVGAGPESTVGTVDEPAAFLTRTNAASVQRFIQAKAAGRRTHLVGGGAQVVAFARAADDLMSKGWTTYADLACFKSWSEVMSYVQEDAQGDELKLMVKLVNDFGADQLQRELAQMPNMESADFVISTTHKSKGLAWDTVQLGPDFPGQENRNVDEMRLLYVGVTRAKTGLDIDVVDL